MEQKGKIILIQHILHIFHWSSFFYPSKSQEVVRSVVHWWPMPKKFY